MENCTKKMVIALKERSLELKINESDKIFMIAINTFYDGVSIDLGAKIVVCDADEEKFCESYYSFVLDNTELKEPVLKFIKQDGDDDRVYFRQQELGEKLLEVLNECDWIDEDTELYIEDYD